MTAPMPGGATRSGTFRRMHASATSGVDRPANPVSIPARPGSIPVTRQRLPAATGTILNARAAPRYPAPRTPRQLHLRHSGTTVRFAKRGDRSAGYDCPEGTFGALVHDRRQTV